MPLYIPWRARLEPHSKPAYLGPKCLTFYFPCLPCLTCNHDLHPPETTGRSFLQFHLSVRVCMYLCLPTGWEPYLGNHPSPYHTGSGEHALYFQYSVRFLSLQFNSSDYRWHLDKVFNPYHYKRHFLWAPGPSNVDLLLNLTLRMVFFAWYTAEPFLGRLDQHATPIHFR